MPWWRSWRPEKPLTKPRYAEYMAVTIQKLDIKVGQVVEIDGRRYDVVADGEGGVDLEPAITRTADQIHSEHGETPLTEAEVTALFGESLSDDEG